MSNSPAPSFLDKKTILAMVFVGICWMGWQFYMQKKYPHLYDQNKAAQTEGVAPAEGSVATTETASAPAAVTSTAPAASVSAPTGTTVLPESFIKYDDERMSFEISSKGMGLKEAYLKDYKDRQGQIIKFDRVSGRLPFETRLMGHNEPLDFVIEKVGETNFVGQAKFGDLTITKVIEVDTTKYLLKTKVSVNGSGTAFLGLSSSMSMFLGEPPQSSFLLPQFDKQEFLINSGGSNERIHITHKENIEQNFAKVSLAAIGDQYFSQALVDRSDVIPDIKVKTILEQKVAWAEVNYPSLGKVDGFTITYENFLGPKYLDLLESIDDNLADVIDYGMFSWLAKKILFFLKWFYQMVGNWGTAIILLTIFVRLLVLPLYMMSYKSMNKMKAIQPQIQSLRERFKNDPPRMNQEMMVLMRENKVNPLGGCLPLLLQFPVFIALYQVLGQSIELYQVPFYGWIHDLSLKDPYYIFPALMGITMFIQQKITPTTLDPVQAKVLMFMPLLFIFFMLGLPSGLAIYMFISALLGILQQLLFMKGDEPKAVVVKEAKK